MKNKILGILLFGVFLTSFGLISAGTENTIVNANIKPAEISFSVPEIIDFGSITQGYQSEEKEFSVVNTGDTDIRVEVSLDDNYEGDVFQNLKFRKNGTVTAKTLSSFYLTINKPTEVGGSVSQNAFAWLDLASYSKDMSEAFDEGTTLIFTAMPN